MCRLWRECARRILRARQRVSWVSALEPGPAGGHALVHALARELEVGARGGLAARAGGTVRREARNGDRCPRASGGARAGVAGGKVVLPQGPPRGAGPGPAGQQPGPAFPPLFLQQVHVLPQTVLYIADAETFSGHEEWHEQKKGNAEVTLLLKVLGM